jgi:hypothetical protein
MAGKFKGSKFTVTDPADPDAPRVLVEYVTNPRGHLLTPGMTVTYANDRMPGLGNPTPDGGPMQVTELILYPHRVRPYVEAICDGGEYSMSADNLVPAAAATVTLPLAEGNPNVAIALGEGSPGAAQPAGTDNPAAPGGELPGEWPDLAVCTAAAYAAYESVQAGAWDPYLPVLARVIATRRAVMTAEAMDRMLAAGGDPDDPDDPAWAAEARVWRP